jgi:predicted AAA+ superfamily ATPase
MRLSGGEMTTAEKQTLCLKFVRDGGFPEPWVKKIEFGNYLGSLFDAVLFRDIVQRYNIRFPGLLADLSRYLISNIAGEFTFRSLTKAVNASSDHTIRKYLGFLGEAFLFFKIPRFSFKVREQIKSAQKIYCYDNGFYLAKAFLLSPNTGKLFENAVAIELMRRAVEDERSIFYWKNDLKEEVDFVVRAGMRTEALIQVCADISDPKVKARETRSLLKAGAALDCKRLIVITNDSETTELYQWFGLNAEIEFVPIWKWLLDRKSCNP